ncbi:MAG: cytidylate kinase family protein [Bacteroidales bacterium]|jgi:cytidylate kinase|nr:cytidylate kinase-like family protein [Bacteroidales bacterium]MDD4215113.1 cytidylate kinase family protein [Bacteroidales bacterium]
MENLLLKYMVERFNIEKENVKPRENVLPFITISREFGCPAKEIAGKIIKELNQADEKLTNRKPWSFISKELLQKASKELNIETGRIIKVLNDKERSSIDEILNALSEKHYYSDRKILKTIDRVIMDFASKGNVIIIGRGGMAVTRSMKMGFHIRLFAPVEWRVEQLMKTGTYKTKEIALSASRKIDFKRNTLLKIKSSRNLDFEDHFDVYYNCKYLSIDEITSSIIHLLQLKKFL